MLRSNFQTYNKAPWYTNSKLLLFVYYCVCLLVCLFACLSRVIREIFHSYGDVIFTGEGLHILTYSRHSLMVLYRVTPIVTRGIRL